MRDLLSKEKELRKKGFADKQIEETVAFLRQKGVETVWDVQAAYDSGLFGLTDRCSFGSHGLCCRNCNLGPCRLDGEDIPFHMKLAVPKTNRSTCGKTADHVVEKAAAIYMGVIALGITTHIGVTPKLGGSPYVINMLTKEMENITGSRLIIEIDPKESAKAMINHIQKKRDELGI